MKKRTPSSPKATPPTPWPSPEVAALASPRFAVVADHVLEVSKARKSVIARVRGPYSWYEENEWNKRKVVVRSPEETAEFIQAMVRVAGLWRLEVGRVAPGSEVCVFPQLEVSPMYGMSNEKFLGYRLEVVLRAFRMPANTSNLTPCYVLDRDPMLFALDRSIDQLVPMCNLLAKVAFDRRKRHRMTKHVSYGRMPLRR